ncbi:hypothetical protein [Actinomadura flavalba]|uniref:hypothetical protein n=1 Tax=Actinomadura flavalba TaxID=1120938 RepID=UPI000381F55A|nr:hypothetical protein [Actinomadura flavalba]
MTWILVVLCLTIAGLELYMAFDRRRGPAGSELADLRHRVAANAEDVAQVRKAQEETGARVGSVIAQINDRLLPDVNERLSRQGAALDRATGELVALRDHLARRLDAAVAASLGAPPTDTVAGGVAATDARPALTEAFERLALRYGLHAELTIPGEDPETGWRLRCYLTGRSPRALETDFLELLGALNDPGDGNPIRDLLDGLRTAGPGAAQLGPLLVARTPEEYVVGVLPLAELRRSDATALLDDPKDAAARLHRLPPARFRDLPAGG